MVANNPENKTKEQIVAGEIYNQFYKYNRSKTITVIDVLKLVQKTKDVNLDKVIATLKAIEKNEVLAVEIITANVLTDREKAALLEKLNKYYSKQIIPVFSIDRGIIGGILIKAGDNVLDSTVATKLRQI